MAASTTASGRPPTARKFCSSEKSKDIEDVLDVLDADLKEISIPPSRHNEILERLRVHTTSPGDLGSLLTKRGVTICCHYGFDSTSPTTGRIALRCLCNILFLAEPTRQMFVDEHYPKEAVERMKNGHPDDELLSARLLLLCTYGTNLDFNTLFTKYHIAKIINANISRHAKLIMSTPWESISAATISACSESLKLLYNLGAHYPHQTASFSESLVPILKMLNKVPIPSPPLQPPLSWLINSLVHLNDEEKRTEHSTRDPLFPSFNENVNVDRLVEILRVATEHYSDEEMDTSGSPLAQVLLRIAESAPPGPKARLRELLLPSNKDREAVLGTGDSLPAKLLRLSTAPIARHLRQLVPALLFELSDKDVERFVHYVGYGFAAGFLLSKGLQPPTSGLESWSIDADNADRSGESVEVNPITGQRQDMERNIHIPEMSDEEKEREAERLFVLFERLRATGVVDVENPVTQAVREGRFEEVD